MKNFLKERCREVAERLGIRKGSGNSYHCPNGSEHNNGDANPSLQINKGGYYCHGCHISGNTLDLIKFVHHCNAKTAFDWIRSSFDVDRQTYNSKPQISSQKKRHVRLIEPSGTRYVFIPEVELSFDEPTLDDIQLIHQKLNKFYSIDTLDKAGVKINRVKGKFGLILWDTGDVKFNPQNHNKWLHVEGRTDYLTAIELKLDKHYGIVSHFNKTAHITVEKGEHVFFMDSDVYPEEIKTSS